MRRLLPSIRCAGAVLGALLLTGCVNGPAAQPEAVGTASNESSASGAPSDKPNMIFVLTDDLSSDLVRYLPEVQRMQREGANFTDYSVSDTLCCPSRASTVTGQFPHNTGIFTNAGDDGGFREFRDRGAESSTTGTELQQAGYATGFMGKYLNGYKPQGGKDTESGYVPPGWNTWAVGGNAYRQFDYQLNENGTVVEYGDEPQDYLTDVISRKGSEFIRSNTDAGKPFYLQLNTFSPHGPATPAPRHRGEFQDVTAPRGPAFNEQDMSDKPGWLRDQPTLTDKQQRRIDKLYGKRVRSLQSIDDMLANLRNTLSETGQADNTYVVFSSDNGFHMGEHRLMPGKQTAFRTDVTVPLVATGPGVPAGDVEQPAQSIDLRSTFGDIAGSDTPSDVDGRSLVPLLRGENPQWRTTSLIEHHGPNKRKSDPDRQNRKSGNPPTYTAIRSPEATYVEYQNGEREYYDRRADPHQLTNSYASLTEQRRRSLHDTLVGLRDCQGNRACFAAGQPE